ncbi:MAG: hypothetical protein LBB15_00840 [Puniceicoccales bacterium]|jgi:MraZ protein|nr:hypothetical protein [Puniceicoccales bacterium]
MAGGSNIYVGEHIRSIDAKARVALPAKWRFGKGNDCVYLALPSPPGCITVYPPNMVEKLSEKVAEVSLGDDVGQRILTRLFSQADQLICDSQGRVQINKFLLSHANLEKEAIVVGNFVTFSIWKPERYGKYMDEKSCQRDEINKILTKLGL